MAKAGPNDWLSATQVDIDGAPSPGSNILKLNVNADVTIEEADVTIVGPLGSRSAATSVSTTASTEDVARTGIVTETAPATDTASSGLNGRLQRIAQRLTSLISLLPTALGSAAAASSFAVTASTEDVARIGIVTETAPASDTASSGLNGRLQRIAQRITSLITLVPASLGRKIASLSFAVAPAGMSYEPVAASDTDEPLGTTGAAGDYLSHIVIQPITTGAGAVTVKDGATTIFLFTSGTLADLSPKTVPFGTFAVTGYTVTTGANVTVLAVGNFT